jgi:hypothetical protein
MNRFAVVKNGLPLFSLAARNRLSPLMAMTLASLACAFLLAALFAAYALFGPERGDAETAAPEWRPPKLAIVELDPPKPASADVQALSRPIFAKKRRPSARALARDFGSVGSDGGPSGVAIAAIVKAGGTEKAFVTSSQTPEGEWKTVGDTIESWTIEAIVPDSVILKNGAQAVRLRLYPDQPQDQPQ